MAARKVSVVEEPYLTRLRYRFEEEALGALCTPFLVCLAAGDLGTKAFKVCISVYADHVKAFVTAYRIIQGYIHNDDVFKTIFDKLFEDLVKELKVCEEFTKEKGINFTETIQANPATIKFTEFLIATALGKFKTVISLAGEGTLLEKNKVAVYTVSAITASLTLYTFLRKELLAVMECNGCLHDILGENWIQKWSSKSFEEFTTRTEGLLEKLSASLSYKDLRIMEKFYGRAMELEKNFFAAQPTEQKSIVPLSVVDPAGLHSLSIFSNFDSTCSHCDANAALLYIAKLNAKQRKDENMSAKLDSVAKESAKYKQCLERYMAGKKEEFSYKSLFKALKELAKYEKRINARVVELKVLKGLEQDRVEAVLHCFPLQDGCIGFFQKIVQSERLNVDVHIMSDSWCADLIRSTFSLGGIDHLDIQANDFAYEESTSEGVVVKISTGEIVKKVETGIEKLKIFKENSVKQRDKSEANHISVYIGSSVGDLLCLVEADLGIVIEPREDLRILATRFGISFEPLFSGLVKRQKELNEAGSSNWKRLPKPLYTVSCWAEIHAFVLGDEM